MAANGFGKTLAAHERTADEVTYVAPPGFPVEGSVAGPQGGWHGGSLDGASRRHDERRHVTPLVFASMAHVNGLTFPRRHLQKSVLTLIVDRHDALAGYAITHQARDPRVSTCYVDDWRRNWITRGHGSSYVTIAKP